MLKVIHVVIDTDYIEEVIQQFKDAHRYTFNGEYNSILDQIISELDK